VLGFEQQLNAQEIERYAEAAVKAADSITLSTGGRRPVQSVPQGLSMTKRHVPSG
jgi:hypothetical protein